MSETAPREWRFYLDDMIGFSEKVIAYTDGFDQTDSAGGESRPVDTNPQNP